MKGPQRLAWALGGLAAVLLALTAGAVHVLIQRGSGLLALAVALAGALAVLALRVVGTLASEAMRELEGMLSPPVTQPLAPVPERGFRVREARPGEVPQAYLAAVLKGDQARRAAWKTGATRQP